MTHQPSRKQRSWRFMAAAVLGLLLSPASGLADWPSTAPIHQANDPSGQAFKIFGGLDFDTGGAPWVAYGDYDVQPDQLVIRAGVWDDSGWSFPTVDYTERGGYGIDLATCGSQVAVSHKDQSCSTAALWRDATGDWQRRSLGPSPCSGDSSVAWDPMTQGCSAGPSVAYRGIAGNGKKNRRYELRFVAGWYEEPVLVDQDKESLAWSMSLAYNAQGWPAIVYQYDDQPRSNQVKLAYSHDGGAFWSHEIVYPREGDPVYRATGVDLAFDSNHHPIVTFRDWLEDHTLKICRRDTALDGAPSSWTCEEIASQSLQYPGSTLWPRLAVDGAGRPLVAYSDGCERVRVATKCGDPISWSWSEGVLWGFGEVAGGGDYCEALAAFAVDSAGSPAVLYWNDERPKSPRQMLRLAWRTDTGPLTLGENGVLCADGADNDCDGLVDDLTDGGDPDCIGDPCLELPPETLCDDGLNNDCDTWIDCEDATDCAADAICQPPPPCLPKNDPCADDGECCSGKCRGGFCR